MLADVAGWVGVAEVAGALAFGVVEGWLAADFVGCSVRVAWLSA
jgi:hypothetical protein